MRCTSKLVRGVIAVVAATAAACGSGGESGSAPEQPPTITSFSAAPTDAVMGHRVTLSWSVDRATGLSISGIGPVTGASISVNPTTVTEYVLTATNTTGSAQARVQVT